MRDILNIFRSRYDQRPRHTIMNRLQDQLAFDTPWEGIYLRFAKESDLESLVAIEERGYNGYQAWLLKDFTYDWHKNPHCVYFILEKDTRKGDRQLVAMMNGRFRYQGAHISHIIVDPAYQGLGYGKFLLSKWFDCAKILETPRISLEVRESNFKAQSLYQDFGFTRRSVKRFYYSDNHEDAYDMVCDLKEGY